jgi:hypothetical protein
MPNIKTPVSYTIVRRNGQNPVRTRYVELVQDYSVTLAESQEIYGKMLKVSNLENEDYIEGIEIDLTKYAYYDDQGRPEFSHRNMDAHEGKRKKASYNAKRNELIIWESSQGNIFKPVYVNDNGVIMKNRDALSDTLQ